MTDKQAIIAKRINKLIAKAQGTDNQHEAEAFMEKAVQLMAENAIDRAFLEAAGKIPREEIQPFPIPMQTTPGAEILGVLLQNMAQIFGCFAFQDFHGDDMEKVTTIVGCPTEVLQVVTLWHSMCIQFEGFYAQSRERGEHIMSDGKKQQARTYRKAFAEGYRREVVARMRARYNDTVQESADAKKTELVLRNKALDVADYIDENYNNLTIRKIKVQSNGVRQGRAAGEKANISNGSNQVSSNQKAITV